MTPIRDLLNRIRWDKRFGRGRFEIGYHDHMVQQVIRVPLEHMQFKEGDRFSFLLRIDEGEALEIPFHRVREVYKNGVLIWKRLAGSRA